MVAIQIPQAQQQSRITGSRHRSLVKSLNGQYWRIAKRQQSLMNIGTCFRYQAEMLPLQCFEATRQLEALRYTVGHTCLYLSLLDPQVTRLLRPYGCIEKLTMLDWQLSELVLTIQMFSTICQAVAYDRVGLHLYIRSLFPRVVTTYEDCLSQLAALIEKQVQS